MGIALKIRALILDNASFKPIRMNGMMMQSYHSVVLRKLFAVFCDTKSLHSVMIPTFKKINLIHMSLPDSFPVADANVVSEINSIRDRF